MRRTQVDGEADSAFLGRGEGDSRGSSEAAAPEGTENLEEASRVAQGLTACMSCLICSSGMVLP